MQGVYYGEGGNIWLCSARKMIDGKPQQVSCHMRHHMEKFAETISTTRYIADSDRRILIPPHPL